MNTAGSTNRTPVLVGIGLISQREEDPARAREPLTLMVDAVEAAGRDTGISAVLTGTQYVAVPRGRWRYRNPAGAVARAIGAPSATQVLADVGVLQQSLIGEACARIARGEAHTTLVTGADAGYRLLRAQITGMAVTETTQTDDPHLSLAPKEHLFHIAERRAGLEIPVALYAIMESAFRARHGWSVDAHRDRLARLYAHFSTIAANNPHAWHRHSVSIDTIRNAGPRNPMQAFPSTRHHCSTWNVDQGSALLFCSVARANALGIHPSKWIYPVASTESNAMVPVSARGEIDACPGARITGEAALMAGQMTIREVDLVELYSCFPIAVSAYAQALGLDLETPHTITGGMPFAGGPFNNYVLHASGRAAELLRQGQRRTALVSSVSGLLTKQAFGLWSTKPPSGGFTCADLSSMVAQQSDIRDVVEDFTGNGSVVGYTVLHSRDQLSRGIVLLDIGHRRRAIATTENPEHIDRLERDEWIGQHLTIDQNRICT